MPWIIIAIAALVAIIVIVFKSSKWQQKQVTKKLTVLQQHLQGLGIKAFLLERGTSPPEIEKKDRWLYTSRSEDVLKLENRNIDYVMIDYITTKNGTYYYLDYIVKATNWPASKSLKVTRLTRKRRFLFLGQVLDVGWKGDEAVINILNGDFALKQKLISSPDVNRLVGRGLSIYPRPEHGYYKMRTGLFLPRSDFFEALDASAKHLKFHS